MIKIKKQLLCAGVSIAMFGCSIFAMQPTAILSAGAATNTYCNTLSLSKVALAQKLYDLNGKPAHSGKEHFIDVTSKTNGYDAIVWANDHKLVSGKTSLVYDGSASVSLQDVVSAFYAMAGSPKTVGDLRGFSDHNKQNKNDAPLIWATQNRIITTNGKRLCEGKTVSESEYENIESKFLSYINMKFDRYICMGDSVSCGYYSNIGINTTFTIQPHAYHSLVSQATGAKLTQLGGHGMRVDELRYILEYEEGKNTYQCDPFHIDETTHMLADPNYTVEYLHNKFVTGISDNENEKSLITLQIGMNELTTAPEYRTLEKIDLPDFNKLGEILGGKNYLKTATEIAKLLPTITTFVSSFFSYNEYYYKLLTQCWEYTIRDIQALNPDATLVVLGGYTSLGASTSVLGKLGHTIISPSVEKMNTFYKQKASTLGYVFADIGNPESYMQLYFDAGGDSMDGHLTAKGNQQVTESILSILPVSSYVKNV